MGGGAMAVIYPGKTAIVVLTCVECVSRVPGRVQWYEKHGEERPTG